MWPSFENAVVLDVLNTAQQRSHSQVYSEEHRFMLIWSFSDRPTQTSLLPLQEHES